MSRKNQIQKAIESEKYITLEYGNGQTRKVKPLEIQDGIVLARQLNGDSKSGRRRGLKSFDLNKIHNINK